VQSVHLLICSLAKNVKVQSEQRVICEFNSWRNQEDWRKGFV